MFSQDSSRENSVNASFRDNRDKRAALVKRFSPSASQYDVFEALVRWGALYATVSHDPLMSPFFFPSAEILLTFLFFFFCFITNVMRMTSIRCMYLIKAGMPLRKAMRLQRVRIIRVSFNRGHTNELEESWKLLRPQSREISFDRGEKTEDCNLCCRKPIHSAP